MCFLFIHSDYSNAEDRHLATSVRAMGVVPLLALLENSLLKPNLFHMLIQHLCQLFIKVDDLCLQAVDHGLLETLCNVIYGFCIVQDRQRLYPQHLCQSEQNNQ